MRVVNGTDETIVLEPGEAIGADVHTHEYDGTMYRLGINHVTEGPKLLGDFTPYIEMIRQEGNRP